MARSFDLSVEYSVAAERVHAAFADEAYWNKRLADSGADTATLDSLTSEGGAIEIVTTQVLRSDRLPGIVSQFHRGDLQIVRTEKWSPIAGGASDGTVMGSIAGAPVALSGTSRLHTTDKGSRLDLKISVEVKIPLVGGKIEGFVGGKLMDLLSAEQRFTSGWIASHG
ncbi:DUF2505 domain-containing protein [Mycobacterium sp. CBMA271]|uniref:DUF2505 domain-containing protein n=1 Tax=unclassified Mycobacteroides TaxID=2618759 RepID=UPI0012DF3AA5|nr:MULTISPECIES: DUF2505 domain-containing protein [unclassified Mycobacteroides]MUM19728.1 hypothetical protein [Mycobacteroides sp. CBMA 326]MUM21117.1 DUF2505 domain-containing protein [Mycobacteroides sp. CBMA 271]